MPFVKQYPGILVTGISPNLDNAQLAIDDIDHRVYDLEQGGVPDALTYTLVNATTPAAGQAALWKSQAGGNLTMKILGSSTSIGVDNSDPNVLKLVLSGAGVAGSGLLATDATALPRSLTAGDTTQLGKVYMAQAGTLTIPNGMVATPNTMGWIELFHLPGAGTVTLAVGSNILLTGVATIDTAGQSLICKIFPGDGSHSGGYVYTYKAST